MSPLQSLLGLFQDPLHLISKRRDKLLDYDHVQYALEHAEEPEKIKLFRDDCLTAKRNYDALNAQLLEELPHFHWLTLRMLRHLLNVLVQAQYSFHTTTSSLLEPLVGTVQPSSTIHQDHATEVSRLAQHLVQLSLVPASLAMNFIAVNTTPPRRRSSAASEGSPMLLPSSFSPPNGGHQLEEEEEEAEEASPAPAQGTGMEILYRFDAQDRAELSVEEGEIVTLLCPHDRIGCREWWLVCSKQGLKGYVPATYLAEAVAR